MTEHEHTHRSGVIPLDDLDDYEVADDNPDVRGWEVLASDGTRVGRVDELLADPAQRRVRYLDVELDEDITQEDDRHVLVPIGAARLHDKADRVYVSGYDPARFTSLPRYAGGPVPADYESRIHHGFGVGRPAGDVEYGHEMFDDRRFYSSRTRI
jgi:sporulation protein YlmC with PRC-barrel domain